MGKKNQNESDGSADNLQKPKPPPLDEKARARSEDPKARLEKYIEEGERSYREGKARDRAGVYRLRDEDRTHDLRLLPGVFDRFEGLDHVEIDGVRVPVRFRARVITERGWRFELVVRVQNGEPVLEGYHATVVEGVDADDPGEPFRSWRHEALTRLMIESGDGRMPISPRASRPGSSRVSDQHLEEVVRLYDEEGLSLRAVAARMTGSKNGTTAKRWLEMAEERGLR